jgi:cytochrome c
MRYRGTGARSTNAAPPIKPYSAPPPKLPVGSVAAGARVYAASCISCHGPSGTGTNKGPRLAHPSNVVATYRTESALYVFVAHNMPANNPGSLTTHDAVNVSTYIWHIAGTH